MKDKLAIVRYYLHYKNQRFRSREALETYQNRKIAEQLDFVTRHSEFYRDYEGKSLQEFPVMDKKQMMEHFNALNTVGIDREEALSFAIDSEKTRSFQPKLQNITVGLSSGTSDTRGAFLISDEEKRQWAGYILSKVLYGSILGKYKVAFFMRANSNLYEAVSSKNIQFLFFDIYRPMEENIEKLNLCKPDILVGQPSVLLEICDAVERQEMAIQPKKVISIAEVLEAQDAERIRRVFGLAVIDQVYQCTEGCLAVTCPHGTIHLNEDIVHIEKEYLDEKRFIPIITDFTRRSQPIIRYRLNDILVERQEPCPCGSCFTALEKIEGREDDVFLFDTEAGGIVRVFPDFIRRCILFAGEVENYRVLQKETGELQIYLDGDTDMQSRIWEEIRRLSEDQGFIMPEIWFDGYHYDKGKKLKRVESQRRRI